MATLSFNNHFLVSGHTNLNLFYPSEKMRKLALILSLALLTLSLTKSAKVDDRNTKNQDTNKMMIKNDDATKLMPESNAMTKMMPESDDGNMMAMPADDMKAAVDLMDLMTQCNESFRTEMAYLMSLNESGSFPDETDKTPKCFIRCVLEKAGIASDDGQFDASRAAEVLPNMRNGRDMDVPALATACAMRMESCKCERAYQFMKCLTEMEIQMYENGNNK